MTVTFGEVLLRLTPPSKRRITQAQAFDCFVGGSEANVAALLAQWDEDASHVTILPDNGLGRLCAQELHRYGVDLAYTLFDASPAARQGLYFCEEGASQRPSRVIYDRRASSFACASPDDFDWENILRGADRQIGRAHV